MSDSIAEIYFFGSLADGFKVYPLSNAVLTKYSAFYNNAGENFKLQITKNGNSSTYTYVRYGLLTAPINGRTGSCFGLSIVFKGKYFNDFDIFLSKICNQIFDALVKEQILLAKNESSGAIAFVPFDLSAVSHRLNEWTKTIQNVIDEKYISYLSNIQELPDFIQGEIECINNLSPNAVILEKLKAKGGIILSPDFPLIEKTEQELIKQKSVEWEISYKNLKVAYDMKVSEFKALEKELSESKSKVTQLLDKLDKKNIQSEENKKTVEATESPFAPGQTNFNYNNQFLHEQYRGQATNTIENYPHIRSKGYKKWLPTVMGIIVIAGLAICIYFLKHDGQKNTSSTNYPSERIDVTHEKPEAEPTIDVCKWGTTTRWYYTGKEIKDVDSLALTIIKNCHKEDCADWETAIKNSIAANNKNDINAGKIMCPGNILIILPSTCNISLKNFYHIK